jgi:hypothetical protein
MPLQFTITASQLAFNNLGVFLKEDPSREEIVGAVIGTIKSQLHYVKEGEEFLVLLVNGENRRLIRFKREEDGTAYEGGDFNKQVYNANIVCLDTGGTKISFPQYQTSPPRPFMSGPSDAISAFKNKVSGIFGGIKRGIEEVKETGRRAKNLEFLNVKD